MRVYAISGHARAGKDTVAGLLAEELRASGDSVLVIHYADLLKFICKAFFGWDGQKDEYGRWLLQYIGTDVVRKQKPDLWVDFVIDMLRLFDGQWSAVIIPDARFPNELRRLTEEGFQVTHIRVERPGFSNELTDVQRAHPSETALDHTPSDVLMLNDGSMEALARKIRDYVTKMEGEE